jgi:hypothetical protein
MRITTLTQLKLTGVLALGLFAGCDSDPAPMSAARVVTHRGDLIGGPRSLADLGDFILENDKVRIAIQGPGFSRGFGVYGGSLLDADLRRPEEWGDSSAGGKGFDSFGELFPTFFLQAVAVDEVVIDSDGSDGGPARIIARGKSGDFLELAAVLNQAVVASVDSDLLNTVLDPAKLEAFKARKPLQYENIYELSPGASHVKITLRVTNIAEEKISFPGKLAKDVLPLLGIAGEQVEGFTVPVGDIALYGKASHIFIPGAGYDLRFALEDAFAKGVELPAFGGLVTDWVASQGEETSYGLMVGESERNYVWNKRDVYEDAETPVSKSSMLLPFMASGFVGIFYENAPPAIEPGEHFELVRYFVIGDGDVGSVLDEMHQIRGATTGQFGGQVFDEVTGQLADNAEVIVYQRRADGGHRIFAQYDVKSGTFSGALVPGDYSLKVVGEGRPASAMVDFTVAAGQPTSVRAVARSAGRIVVNLTNKSGSAMPGKATAVGVYDASHAGELPRTFLFDLEAGEEFRTSDLVPDTDDPGTRRYIEAAGSADNGVVELLVRPGTYRVTSSRGPEYNTIEVQIDVKAGATVSLAHSLERVVDTTGWIASDLHLHSINSVDSGMKLSDRVRAVAAEGVEWAVSTDHNFITDYTPYIQAAGLSDWLGSSVGLELSTLESGHFNGYPLDYDVGAVGHGSFEWARRTPDELFAELRALGRYGPENTIVQVNHARDTILGYFGQYDRSALDASEIVASGITAGFTQLTGPAFRDEAGDTVFSWDFDALELLNGKLFWQIHHYRVPERLPAGELPEEIPPAGAILVDEDGEVAFPGVVDDWYNLLNLGHRFVGVGTSDSHAGDDEPGYFRTMVHVGTDDPRGMHELDFVRGMKSRRVVATNGPMIDFSVNGTPTGGEVVDADGVVRIDYRLQAARWVGLDQLNVIRNGLLIDVIPVPAGRDLAAEPIEGARDYDLARDADGNAIDTWFLLQAIGSRSMFPVVRPLELPPLVLTDAISSLAGPLGFGDAAFGDLKPAESFPITAYAITNPIWIKTADGRDWIPPGLPELMELNAAGNHSGLNNNPVIRAGAANAQALEALAGVRAIGHASTVGTKPVRLFERNENNEHDVRRLFTAFGHAFH